MSTVLDEVAGIIPPVVDDVPKQQTAPVPGRGRGRPRKSPSSTATSLKTEAPETPMPRPGVLRDAVAELYGFAGFGLMPFRPQTAQTMMASAKSCGEAWEAAAAANPQIRAMLLSLTKTSTYGVLIAAHAPIVMAAIAEQRERKVAKDGEPVPVGDRPEADGRAAYSSASAMGPVSV